MKVSTKKVASNIKSFALVILLAIIFRAFVFEPFRIPSGSMKNTLLIGDYIFVKKFSYGYSQHSLTFPVHNIDPLDKLNFSIFFAEPKRGDVVVFRPPKKLSIYYIKRIIGLPGDKIQIIRGVPHINGKPVRHKNNGVCSEERGEEMLCITEITPENKQYTIIKEKKENNYRQSYINNTDVFTVPEGQYFVMGDNRNHSFDSRFSDIGMIPLENIVGKAITIAASFSTDEPLLIRPNRIFKAIR